MNTDKYKTLDLNQIYDKLDYSNGQLLSVTDTPSNRLDLNNWLNKGEWLTAAKRAGAEKIFFIDNNPIILFAKCSDDPYEINECFNRFWSLARPRILFLATPSEISVIDLAQKPVRYQPETAKEQNNIHKLKILHDVRATAEILQDFHRDNIESGKVFESNRFGDLKNRADQSLIADLKTVRLELIESGLGGEKIEFAHALIGRSIFIRYLEDRGILTEEYFKRVARQRSGWTDLLNISLPQDECDYSNVNALYPRVLKDKDFTYAMFRALAKDFNGDMFPDVDNEEKSVELKHLSLIQELLYGDAGIQKKLLFFSYRFDIIPLDLISSIYELFYHSTTDEEIIKSRARQSGVYYTPPVLSEFVLSRVLTDNVLKKKPRVLDPACGSGIFLVEAFRRMVRYEWRKNRKPLSFDELKEILKNQIFGIEINEPAARITAFSLYLAMLHYLDPPSIQGQIKNGNKLPNLLISEGEKSNNFNSIWVGNAFDEKKINANKFLKDKFGSACFDVIVGNPPWGSPGNIADKMVKQSQEVMLQWCNSKNYPIGDKEPSQAFLWRALEFLKDGGVSSLLTSAGVLLKHGTTTKTFRKEWMSQVQLKEVFNFTHVRKFFFQGGVSPFLIIYFSKKKQGDNPVEYWSAKQVLSLKETQAVLLSKYDLNYLVDVDLTDNKTWKVNWFGRHADNIFLNQLKHCYSSLSEYTDFHCVGFKVADKSKNSEWLSSFKSLINTSFSRYGNLSFEKGPQKVEHRGKNEFCYKGPRIIIKEGLEQRQGTSGKIIARYETIPFSFNHSFHVLKLHKNYDWAYKVLLGCLLSSFARYYFFLTSANWGVWHDKVLIKERLDFPIIFFENNEKTKRIVNIINKLQNYQPQEKSLIQPDGIPENEISAQREKWEAELDEAVFDLYEFSEEQRDLIRDCCEVTLPFFYQPFDSIAVMSAVNDKDLSWIKNYTEIFARRWKPYLQEDEVLRANVHVGAHDNMLAVEFFPADAADEWDLAPEEETWDHVLEEIGKSLPQPMGTSQVVRDGIVRIVSDKSIIIIKRNEKRFWTRSLAREDADSTLLKTMQAELDSFKGDK